MFAGSRAVTYGKAKDQGRVFRNALDGCVRFRIDERQGRLTPLARDFVEAITPQASNLKALSAPLGHVLDHPELFDAYPELYRQATTINPSSQIYKDGEVEGSVTRTMLEMILPVATPLQQAYAVLKHEVQHCVQRIEGHARGSNLENEIANVLYARLERMTPLEHASRFLKDLPMSGPHAAEAPTLKAALLAFSDNVKKSGDATGLAQTQFIFEGHEATRFIRYIKYANLRYLNSAGELEACQTQAEALLGPHDPAPTGPPPFMLARAQPRLRGIRAEPARREPEPDWLYIQLTRTAGRAHRLTDKLRTLKLG